LKTHFERSSLTWRDKLALLRDAWRLPARTDAHLQQLECTQQRIQAEGLQDQVTVELRDYRDLAGDGVYDKVASVGMFEHVGLAKLPTYLATVRRVLRPGGLFLNHGITQDEEGWNKTG
jgi:cyclopropane-fatty-acyl-phospholipid synthase